MEVELPKTIEECHILIRHLLSVIGKMQAEIDELKEKLNQNSQNSNRPPASDGFNKPKPRPAFEKEKKRLGGQVGHKGKTLQRVEKADVLIDCLPESCECGLGDLGSEMEVVETRQVFELPEPRLEVIEYRRIKRKCKCGKQMRGKFPEKVTAPVQYGDSVQAFVSLLSVQCSLSYEKIGELFSDLYDCQINEATTQAMVKRVSEALPIEEIKSGVINSELVNVDETSVRENGKLKWYHTASTAELTYQFVHEKRGIDALVDEKSIFGKFTGIAVHDCLRPLL
jgi:transposase